MKERYIGHDAEAKAKDEGEEMSYEYRINVAEYTHSAAVNDPETLFKHRRRLKVSLIDVRFQEDA